MIILSLYDVVFNLNCLKWGKILDWIVVIIFIYLNVFVNCDLRYL